MPDIDSGIAKSISAEVINRSAQKGQGEGALLQTPCCRGYCRSSITSDSRTPATPAYCHLRSSKRKRILYRVCSQSLQSISLYDSIRLHKQSLLHFPSGHGKGCGIDFPFNGQGDCLRRRLRPLAASLLRPERGALFHAPFRYSHIHHCIGFNCQDLQRA